jgi:DNA-directed RNA polymerase subunit RPC12/RpoP
MLTPVKVKCKKCGRDAKSDEFILDPVYKMMVCKDCVKDRRMAESSASKQKAQEARAQAQAQEKKSMPAGWDSEDAEIERAFKAKQSQAPVVEKISDEKIKYTCTKCKYQFIFNTIEKRPPRCPYCATPVKY